MTIALELKMDQANELEWAQAIYGKLVDDDGKVQFNSDFELTGLTRHTQWLIPYVSELSQPKGVNSWVDFVAKCADRETPGWLEKGCFRLMPLRLSDSRAIVVASCCKCRNRDPSDPTSRLYAQTHLAIQDVSLFKPNILASVRDALSPEPTQTIDLDMASMRLPDRPGSKLAVGWFSGVELWLQLITNGASVSVQDKSCGITDFLEHVSVCLACLPKTLRWRVPVGLGLEYVNKKPDDIYGFGLGHSAWGSVKKLGDTWKGLEDVDLTTGEFYCDYIRDHVANCEYTGEVVEAIDRLFPSLDSWDAISPDRDWRDAIGQITTEIKQVTATRNFIQGGDQSYVAGSKSGFRLFARDVIRNSAGSLFNANACLSRLLDEFSAEYWPEQFKKFSTTLSQQEVLLAYVTNNLQPSTDAASIIIDHVESGALSDHICVRMSHAAEVAGDHEFWRTLVDARRKWPAWIRQWQDENANAVFWKVVELWCDGNASMELLQDSCPKCLEAVLDVCSGAMPAPHSRRILFHNIDRNRFPYGFLRFIAWCEDYDIGFAWIIQSIFKNHKIDIALTSDDLDIASCEMAPRVQKAIEKYPGQTAVLSRVLCDWKRICESLSLSQREEREAICSSKLGERYSRLFNLPSASGVPVPGFAKRAVVYRFTNSPEFERKIADSLRLNFDSELASWIMEVLGESGFRPNSMFFQIVKDVLNGEQMPFFEANHGDALTFAQFSEVFLINMPNGYSVHALSSADRLRCWAAWQPANVDFIPSFGWPFILRLALSDESESQFWKKLFAVKGWGRQPIARLIDETQALTSLEAGESRLLQSLTHSQLRVFAKNGARIPNGSTDMPSIIFCEPHPAKLVDTRRETCFQESALGRNQQSRRPICASEADLRTIFERYVLRLRHRSASAESMLRLILRDQLNDEDRRRVLDTLHNRLRRLPRFLYLAARHVPPPVSKAGELALDVAKEVSNAAVRQLVNEHNFDLSVRDWR